MNKAIKSGSRIVSVLISSVMVFMIAITGAVAAADPTSSNTTSTPNYNNTDDKEPAGHADLMVKEVQTQYLTQGLNNEFMFTIKNRNLNTARNVRITAEGDGDYASKFTFVEGTNTYITRDFITTSNVDISTKLKIDASVPDGVYKLNIKFTYKTYDGVDSPAVTEPVLVYVNGFNDKRPYVKSVSFDKAEIGKDNKAKMTVTIENPTNQLFEGMDVELLTGETKEFTLYENFKPAFITSIAPNSTATAEFSVYIATTVVTGNYPISFKLTYRDQETVIYSHNSSLFAQVKRSPDAETGKDGSTPRIIVNKYSTDVEEIKAGKSFKLDFTLENTSKAAVGNMKITVGSPTVTGTGGTGTGGAGAATGSVFFPVSGSNSFFVNNLAAGATVSQQIELMAKQDIEPGVYQVLLELEYEDSAAKQFKSEESIAFNVSQEQRLEIAGFTPPTMGSGGMGVPITFQYINKGKSTIYNLSISTDGPFKLDGGDLYIGNLTAGFNDYFDGSIIPDLEATGEQKGAIVLKFEDSLGNKQELRSDFTMTVDAGMDMGVNGGMDIAGGMTPMPPEGMMIDPETGEMVPIKAGFPWWGFVIIGAVVLGGAAVTFIIIMKKRKAKKEQLNDEED